MLHTRVLVLSFIFIVVSALLGPAAVAEEEAASVSPFTAAEIDGAELRFVEGVPVAIFTGSPDEMGRQQARLIGPQCRRLMAYPRMLLLATRGPDAWTRLQREGAALAPRIPARHRRELEAFATAAGIEPDEAVAANVMVDAYRGGLGCSSIIALAGRSATGGPVFGRNLDFPTFNMLHNYSMVSVYRPEGKRAFASIGFPGLIGCLSGMNDAGLALAIHECGPSADGAAAFNAQGTPYMFLFRRILEECSTVDQAAQVVEAHGVTTKFNLAVCDRRSAAVLECTPTTVARRDATRGLLFCTNHYRTSPLAVPFRCRRYDILCKAQNKRRLALGDVRVSLAAVGSDRSTLQTMIFEPAADRLHVAIGDPPTSRLPLVLIDLAPLFATDTRAPLSPASSGVSGEGL